VQVFNEVGSPQAWSADNFFRGDYIPIIKYDGRVVAFFVATQYPLQNSIINEHSYFSIFPNSAVEELQKRKIKTLMSYEFLSVIDPRLRKENLGFSIAPVLGMLGQRLRDSLGCEAAIGVARKQNKIDQGAVEIGGVSLAPEVKRGNLICQIMAFFPELDKIYPDPRVVSLADYLWDTRVMIGLDGEVLETSKAQKVA
jgi:hypothetical protein